MFPKTERRWRVLMRKRLLAVIALFVAAAVTGVTFGVTVATTTATANAVGNSGIATVTGANADGRHAVVPSWNVTTGTVGGVDLPGDLFVIGGTGFTGDLSATLYLNNAAQLTKAYSYLNLGIVVYKGVTVAQNTTWEQAEGGGIMYLTLTNGYVSFALHGLGATTNKYSIGIDAGSFYCVNAAPTSPGTPTPAFYLDVVQR
jgi:hypothetical protein